MDSIRIDDGEQIFHPILGSCVVDDPDAFAGSLRVIDARGDIYRIWDLSQVTIDATCDRF